MEPPLGLASVLGRSSERRGGAMKRRLAIMAAITALAIPVALAEGRSGTATCAPGTWPTVWIALPNGDRSSYSVRGELPPGHYIETYSSDSERITIDSEGNVTAKAPPGSKIRVECIASTH
jgi:hypothetical protein